MKYYYDLHIHTALSPCADDDMTPSNIVNMAKLSNLDIIAITDHNSVLNAAAVINASKREEGPLVIPGMELTTSEDIHTVILFESIDKAEAFGQIVENNRIKVKNKKNVFGAQLVLDQYDNFVSEQEHLLIAATDFSIEQIKELAEKFEGVAFPAHIDKPYNSIIAILGRLPKELGFKTVEISQMCSSEDKQKFIDDGYLVLSDSDSHFLGVMNENGSNYLELETLSAKSVIEKLKKGI